MPYLDYPKFRSALPSGEGYACGMVERRTRTIGLRRALSSTASRTATLAVASFVAVAQWVDAATIAVDAHRQGDMIEVHASAQLQATSETAWRVLTAYDRYPDFIPDLRTSRIVARLGTIVTVEQSGDARVGKLPVPMDITFEIVESPPRGLQSRAISGSLRALQSSYTLTPGAIGVRLDYVGKIATGFGFFGTFELRAVELNVARQFQALADEIDRQSGAEVMR